MTDKETEKWLSEMYKYTSNFDFRRLNKYEDANDDLHIDDLILDYTMLYEFYKKRTKKLQKENKLLKIHLNVMKQDGDDTQDRIDKTIEYIEKFEDIKAYYSYEENGYEEYNYDEKFKEELLNILRGVKE